MRKSLANISERFAGKKTAVLGSVAGVLAIQAEALGAVEFSRLFVVVCCAYFLGQGIADHGRGAQR